MLLVCKVGQRVRLVEVELLYWEREKVQIFVKQERKKVHIFVKQERKKECKELFLSSPPCALTADSLLPSVAITHTNKEGLQVDTEIPPDSCFAFIRLIREGDIE